MIPLLVAFGGALGALARYGIAQLVHGGLILRAPLATLLVNISGSLVLGIVLRATATWPTATNWRAFLAIGFCGAFTTFSAFSYETMQLLQQRQHAAALANVVLNVVLCLLAAAAGFAIATGGPAR